MLKHRLCQINNINDIIYNSLIHYNMLQLNYENGVNVVSNHHNQERLLLCSSNVRLWKFFAPKTEL